MTTENYPANPRPDVDPAVLARTAGGGEAPPPPTPMPTKDECAIAWANEETDPARGLPGSYDDLTAGYRKAKQYDEDVRLRDLRVKGILETCKRDPQLGRELAQALGIPGRVEALFHANRVRAEQHRRWQEAENARARRLMDSLNGAVNNFGEKNTDTNARADSPPRCTRARTRAHWLWTTAKAVGRFIELILIAVGIGTLIGMAQHHFLGLW